MESLHHLEYCDGEKHWVYCSKPVTWEKSCDWRPCTNKCAVFIEENKGNLQNCEKSTDTQGLVNSADKCTSTSDLCNAM